MTTIATDGRTIAADGLACGGDERITDRETKIIVGKGCIYAFAGRMAVFDAAISWHQAGAVPGDVPAPSLEWMLLVIDRDGMRTYRHDCPYPNAYEYPQAFGTGDSYAVAALACGKTPVEAVEIAARFDIRTGGQITEIDIAAALGLPRAVAA